MKKISMFALALSFAFISANPLAAQLRRDQQRDQVCVYENNQFNGWEQCFNPGDEVTNLRDHRDKISSIRVFGRASVTIYEDGGFGGNSATFSSDVTDLALRSMSGSKTWNDRVESLRVSSGLGNTRPGQSDSEVYGGRGVTQSQTQRQNGICVYDRVNYKGRMECWQPGDEVADLARVSNWNDKISSIQIFGNTTVVAFQNAQFNGEQVVINRSIPDLSQLRMGRTTWNDQISALEIDGGQQNNGRGRGRGRGRGNVDQNERSGGRPF